ncbi:FtsX-like permease family protein [Clostridiaceae bacterium HFYG-1003]|nr:FtsX-like permease family protein [Clostridiaceae bacterium HFYG-1003]
MIQIAWKGLLGRKKDSFMLLSVLFLSFVFSILTSTFYTNSETAKAIQRQRLYGTWEYAAYGVAQAEDPLSEIPAAVRGTNRIIGHSPNFGTLASFDEGFRQLAGLSLIEGRLPSEADEVALENNQLSYFEQIPKIGDELIADTEVFLYDLETDRTPEQTRELMQEKAMEHFLAGTDPAFRQLMADMYGKTWGSAEMAELMKRDLPKLMNIQPGNRERRRGLDHFEDTLLIPNEELLNFDYWVDLSLLANQEDLSPTQKLERLSLYNDYLLAQLTRPDAAKPEFSGSLSLSYKKSYIIRRTLKLTGVYATISTAWQGPSTQLPTALVTQAASEKFIERGLLQTEVAKDPNYAVPVNHYVRLAEGAKLPAGSDGKVVANTLAYPPGDSTDGILALSILVFIFFITLFGVFQLYLSQLGKRLRKLGLLRSVGATIGQIRQLLIWELLLLTGLTLPLALGLGIGLANLASRGILDRTPRYQFTIQPGILALSILSGLVAVMLGVLGPLRKVRSIPLTGKTEAGRARRGASVRRILGARVRPLRNLNQVLAHHRRFTRRQSAMTQIIYTVIFTLTILSLLLSFLAFAKYRDQVVAVSMPDYDLTFPYALSSRDLTQFDRDLKATGAVTELQHLIGRSSGQLSVQGDGKDPLYGLTASLTPLSRKGELFVTLADTEQYPTFFTEGQRKVNVYGIQPGTALYETLNERTGNRLEADDFQSGRSVVILYPSYFLERGKAAAAKVDELNGVRPEALAGAVLEQTGGARLSFDFRDSPVMEQWQGSVPARVRLTFQSEENTETMRNVLPPSQFDLQVAELLTSFPEFGIWPFSQDREHPVVLGSQSLIRQMTQSNRNIELLAATPPNQTLVPTLYGTQRTSIWTGQNHSDESYLKIQQVAHRYGGRVQNLYADKISRFNAALRISVMVLIVAFIIGLVALQIQLNISKARIEAERLTIGTLQSLGVNSRKLKRAYLRTGMTYSLKAVALSHTVFLLVLVVRLVQSNPWELVRSHFVGLLRGELWLYPWLDHLLVTTGFLVIGTFIYYLPLRRVLRNHPIHNIRQL